MLKQIVRYTFGAVILYTLVYKSSAAGQLFLDGAQGYGIAVSSLEGKGVASPKRASVNR